jgi:hypothetical protein
LEYTLLSFVSTRFPKQFVYSARFSALNIRQHSLVGVCGSTCSVVDALLPVLPQVGTKLQLGSPDPVDDSREQAASLAGHVAVVQGLQMVIDTIQ